MSEFSEKLAMHLRAVIIAVKLSLKPFANMQASTLTIMLFAWRRDLAAVLVTPVIFAAL